MRSSLCALAIVAALVGPLGASARTIDFPDLRLEVRVSTPQISPDGKSIAVVVSHQDFASDKWVSQLMLIDVATGKQRPLTQERDDVNSAAWSPSGDRIAFIAQHGQGDDAHEELYVLPMAGGDAMAITNSPTDVQQYVWSPDGTQLAYVAADEAPKHTGEAKYDNAFQVGDNDFLARSVPPPAHLWVVPASGGGARRLTSGTWSLPQGAFSASIDWSADGRTIAFDMAPDAISAHWYRSTLELVDAATGKMRPLGASSGFGADAAFSPDGTEVAYEVARHGDPYFQRDVDVARVGGTASDVTTFLDRNVFVVGWAPDGKSVLIQGHDKTFKRLWWQPIGGTAIPIDTGDVSVSDATVARTGAIAFVGETGTRPAEVYYVAPRAQPAAPVAGTTAATNATPAARRVSDFNAAIAGLDLGKTAPVEWPSADGFVEDGVLTYPPAFDPAKKYPLVLMIHGGPVSSSTQTFDEYFGLPQIAAARGWVVFQPNYRGSDNLGDAFTQAIIGHVASGPGRDIMDGVAAVEKLGFVDTSRIGVSGWSGGGLLTAWLVGQAHIWKAAVAGAAVTNWVDQYALDDVTPAFVDTLLGGSPLTAMAAYRAESPITYARDVRTPTLVLSDTGDYRVPTPQAFEFYHALRDNHVEARFVMLPRRGYFPGDPAGREQVKKLWIGWFEEHFK